MDPRPAVIPLNFFAMRGGPSIPEQAVTLVSNPTSDPADYDTPAARPRTQWTTFITIGVIGGVLSGLFAIGGGILMVPLLVSRARMDQRRATATSLVAIIPPAIASSVTYLAHDDVDLAAGGLVALGAIFGALLGSRLLRRLPLTTLRWAFIVFIVAVAARLLFITPARGQTVDLSANVMLGYIGLGLLMGIASGLFGIGGGIVAVPLLVSLFAVSDLVAKGTSLLVSIPTSIVGTLGNRRNRLVDVRAGLIVGAAAAAASVPAVYIAVAIPPRVSAILFAALLLAVAAQLTTKALHRERKA